jgi:type IV secretion system protein VirD4
MLDELATLGPMAPVENAVGLAAGYGIQLFTVWQDVAQMRDLYQGRWASFIGNSGVRAVFSLDDYDSARYWADFIGGQTVQTRSESRDVLGVTQGETAGETLRPVLTPDELMLNYATDRMLVLPTDRNRARPLLQRQKACRTLGRSTCKGATGCSAATGCSCGSGNSCTRRRCLIRCSLL